MKYYLDYSLMTLTLMQGHRGLEKDHIFQYCIIQQLMGEPTIGITQYSNVEGWQTQFVDISRLSGVRIQDIRQKDCMKSGISQVNNLLTGTGQCRGRGKLLVYDLTQLDLSAAGSQHSLPSPKLLHSYCMLAERGWQWPIQAALSHKARPHIHCEGV